MGQRLSQSASDNEGNSQEVSWWFRLLIRAVGVISGIVAMALGIFACVSVHATCIASGVLMFVAGAIVVLLEAPCCCQFIEFANKIGEFSEKRPPWQKALFYFVLPVPSLAMCFQVSTFFGAIMIIVTGVLYGLQVIGKKAPREAMVMRASMSQSGTMEASLVSSEQPPGYSDAPPTQSLPPLTGTVTLPPKALP